MTSGNYTDGEVAIRIGVTLKELGMEVKIVQR